MGKNVEVKTATAGTFLVFLKLMPAGLSHRLRSSARKFLPFYCLGKSLSPHKNRLQKPQERGLLIKRRGDIEIHCCYAQNYKSSVLRRQCSDARENLIFQNDAFGKNISCFASF